MPKAANPLALKAKSLIRLDIKVYDDDVKRLARIFNLSEDLGNSELKELFGKTRDACLEYYGSKLDEQLKPNAVVDALDDIIGRIQNLHDALPGLALLRRQLAEINCVLQKNKLNYNVVLEERKRTKSTNRKTIPLKKAVAWLWISFVFHNSKIQKDQHSKAWGEYVDFALTLAKIRHPDPATNRTRWLKLIDHSSGKIRL